MKSDRARAASATVRIALLVRPPSVAEIVALLETATFWAIAENVAEKLLAEIVTDAGTVATPASELESATTAPPGGAALPNVIVPVEVPPDPTFVGLKERTSGLSVAEGLRCARSGCRLQVALIGVADLDLMPLAVGSRSESLRFGLRRDRCPAFPPRLMSTDRPTTESGKTFEESLIAARRPPSLSKPMDGNAVAGPATPPLSGSGRRTSGWRT
jgi:hypothetical protein